MKAILVILISLASTFAGAQPNDLIPVDGTALFGVTGEFQYLSPSCNFTSSEKDSTLEPNTSLYEFSFNLTDIIKADSFSINYSVDGISKQEVIKTDGRLEVVAKPGAHVFIFTLSIRGNIVTDSIPIKAQHRDYYQVDWGPPTPYPLPEAVLCKPIIYLYPEEETNVTVNLDIKGTNPFFYPAYKDNWEFVAQPNGDLIFGEDTYNYLFWEATPSSEFQLSQDVEGFMVAKEDVVTFLEEKLTLANFSSKEQADFITYWAPQLIQNQFNFVHFVFNETGDRYAEMNIEPTPESIYRIYMIWSAVPEPFEVHEQLIPTAKRDGFHVIEWGGQENTIPSFSAQLMH